MATVDTQKSLLTYLFNLLTTDEDLQTACGGAVKLFPEKASPDTEFPYLIHRIEPRADSDFFPMIRATYILDIYSYSPNQEEILAIRKKIIELLDELQFSTNEASNVRIWYQADTPVVDYEENIWHRAFLWNLRYYRKTEVAGILSR